MKPYLLVLLFCFTLLGFPSLAQEQQVVVPYTLADRDRAIRTEANMESKFESQQRQLDDIKTLFYWGFGILITLLIFIAWIHDLGPQNGIATSLGKSQRC